jgi:hypothetical protein
MIGESRNACSILVQKPGRKRPRGRPKHSKMDLGDIEWGNMDWIHLA